MHELRAHRRPVNGAGRDSVNGLGRFLTAHHSIFMKSIAKVGTGKPAAIEPVKLLDLACRSNSLKGKKIGLMLCLNILNVKEHASIFLLVNGEI